MRRRRHIFLIGFSGSGKSTVGRILAARLKYRFVDLDVMIEKRARRRVAEIFANTGEQSFRRMELSHLSRVVKSDSPMVIALGGGAFQTVAIRRIVQQYGLSVFLSCSQRELYRRLRSCEDRPLLEAKRLKGETPVQARHRRARDLLNKRLANYRTADLILSTTHRTAAQAAGCLVQLLKKI